MLATYFCRNHGPSHQVAWVVLFQTDLVKLYQSSVRLPKLLSAYFRTIARISCSSCSAIMLAHPSTLDIATVRYFRGLTGFRSAVAAHPTSRRLLQHCCLIRTQCSPGIFSQSPAHFDPQRSYYASFIPPRCKAAQFMPMELYHVPIQNVSCTSFLSKERVGLAKFQHQTTLNVEALTLKLGNDSLTPDRLLAPE